MIILPTRTDVARYYFTTQLDNVTFRLNFEWNDRAGGWFMDVYDASDVLLLSGVRIVVNYPFMNKYRDARLPEGMLEAIDTSDEDLDPGLKDLGDRVKLVYTPAADLPASITI